MIFWINIIPVHSQCLNDQKSLLLQLKNSLIFNSAISVKLVNWTQVTDCCDWKGVNCDQEGHVIGLDLNSEGITVESTKAVFSIPIGLSLLTRLAVLDLSSLHFTETPSLLLENPSLLTLLQNLKGLTELHLDGVNISASGSEWCRAISSSVPNLRVLSLNGCYLSGPIDVSLQNLRFLSENNLDSNHLFAPVPTLQTLELESNSLLSGSLPEFPRRSKLKKLVLSETNLSGALPDSIGNLRKLSRIELAFCRFSGPIPNYLEDLSQLVHLDLSSNVFTGPIPSFQMSKNLSYIDLSHNNLTGPVPDAHFEGLSNLLRGEIPVPDPHAVYVDYSNNNFSSSLPAEIGNNLFFATFFAVSNNMHSGAIPPSICNATYLRVLDLSNNKFSGTIPQCLIETNTKTLGVLNLRNNHLSGAIPETFPQGCALKTLDLNGNCLEGEFPGSLANCTKLEVLNLGNNNIRDIFPCFLKNSSTLHVLVLRSNKFQGGICCPGVADNTWSKLQIIDLALNNFSGDLLPNCFLSWKAMMVDMGSAQPVLNHLHFEFLNLNNFYYQDTVKVTMKGLEMELVKIITVFTSVDFSCNNFTGQIPEAVGALKSLYVLNLSHNALTGRTPPSLGNLSQLESLDLSLNKLSGSIPVELASLTLSYLKRGSLREWDAKVPIVLVLPTEEGNSAFEAYIYISAAVGMGSELLHHLCTGKDGEKINEEDSEEERFGYISTAEEKYWRQCACEFTWLNLFDSKQNG
ncbi:receptor-like protein 33 [Actinidia eriantha]|uniref:receptor-like protein 33 n=1 Tax=Actinidia eriantha TaxID=165200 RepID=UPI00258E5912|nr:receptor-like protein 33 [Actinidia eriantha]